MKISNFGIIRAFAIGALLIGLPAVVHAEPDEGMRHGRFEQHRGMHDGQHFVSHAIHNLIRHAKDLGLSEEQVAKLKTLSTDYKKTSIRDKAEMKLAEVDARTLAHDEKSDLSAVENAMRKAEAARTNLRLDGVKAIRAARAVLTPEQREQWRSRRGMMHAQSGDSGMYGETEQHIAMMDGAVMP